MTCHHDFIPLSIGSLAYGFAGAVFLLLVLRLSEGA